MTSRRITTGKTAQRSARVNVATAIAATTNPSVTTQPSVEMGDKPHPSRLGPNHALRPSRGFVLMGPALCRVRESPDAPSRANLVPGERAQSGRGPECGRGAKAGAA